MRLLVAFVRHELAMQSRSMRFRATTAAYLVLASSSSVTFALRPGIFWSGQPTPGPFAMMMQLTHPGLAAILAWVLAVDAINREREANAFVALMLSPIGNLGYVLRRFVAVALIVVTLTAVAALAGAGCAIAIGVEPAGCAPLAWIWVLQVVPVAICVTAFALGAGTIAGNGMAATIGTIFLLGLALGVGNDLLARVGRKVEGPGEWMNVEGLAFLPFLFERSSVDEEGRRMGPWLLTQASDGPFEPREAVRYLLPRSVIWAGLSVATLLLSPVFLRRTRPDAKPWRIRSDHPLRTYIAYAKQLKEHLTPDAALPRAELATAVGSFALVALGFTFVLRADSRYRALARERFAAESAAWPAPTPAGLELRRVDLRGGATIDGELTLRVTQTFHNAGALPVDRAALTLNQGLAIAPERASGVAIERRWNRLELQFASPIAPGGDRVIGLTLRGVPATIVFSGERGKFVEWYSGIDQARLTLWIPDLSRSRALRHLSARRTQLRSDDLFPVPRYAPWTDDDDPRYQKGELHAELTYPSGLVLASDAGAVGGRDGRIAWSSTQNLADVLIAGGALDEQTSAADTRMFVTSAHRTYANASATAITDALERITTLWPEMASGARWVVLELCRPFRMTPSWDDDRQPAITGAILEIPESFVRYAGRRGLTEERLASKLRVRHYLSKREIARDDTRFFWSFYDAIAARELGAERQACLLSQAVDADERLSAVMVDLRRRVGARAMDDAVAEFLARPGPGNKRELVDLIETRASVSLERFYDDYVEGRGMPNLELRDVRFERSGDRWTVRGEVANRETGEALCPVFLRTEIDRQSTLVTVPDGGSIAFTFVTPYKPLGVELDPNKECFRYQPKTARIGVTFQ